MTRTSSVAAGVVIALLGLACLIWPYATGTVTSIFVGAGLLVSGISALFSWWQLRKVTPSGLVLVFAIVLILMGLQCLIFPLATTITIWYLMAGCIIAAGLFRIIGAISSPFVTGSLMALNIISGVISILFGGMAFAFPDMIMYFLGFGLILSGITAIVVGVKAKDADPFDVDPR